MIRCAPFCCDDFDYTLIIVYYNSSCNNVRRESAAEIHLVVEERTNFGKTNVPKNRRPVLIGRRFTYIVSGFSNRAEELHLFLNGSLDCLKAGSQDLTGVKALSFQILALLNVLAGSCCK